GDTTVAVEALELVAAVNAHAVRLQQPLKEAPGAPAERAFEGGLLLHHDRAVLADRRKRSGDLAADVGAPDQHHLLGVGDPLPDRVGVGERAQVIDLLEIAAVDIQPADIGTRGDQRLLELDLLLAREPDGTAVEIDPRDARAQHQLDALLAPPVVRAEERLLPALLAAHVA